MCDENGTCDEVTDQQEKQARQIASHIVNMFKTFDTDVATAMTGMTIALISASQNMTSVKKDEWLVMMSSTWDSVAAELATKRQRRSSEPTDEQLKEVLEKAGFKVAAIRSHEVMGKSAQEAVDKAVEQLANADAAVRL